ncbi:suppressor of fused domain protein [Catellatospora citrea]|uniref:Suppressor of fused-like domain-containing protein n=1 Tax=Catellatospora citrea TaxID=53366 RepID=A0A8J3KQP6_9ACTN|nr:suppressor of fused domain protein [Catellatospora citrea]RKE11915.1 suppressor of fused protein SUFU [Catellatospora citrea]GIG00250.1 hypothetical protein Cci01nite_53430 [Catellatospora citrea]
MTDLIAHLESFLGLITGGTRGDDSTPSGVQVAWFAEDVPFAGVTTMATVGLSRYHLAQSTDAGIHHELLMHLPTHGQPANAAGVLFQVARMAIARGYGLARGEILGPSGTLFEGTPMTALYAATPGYLPAAFHTCETSAATIVMTCLVPLTTSDAIYARTHGWRALEQAIAEEQPDLVNLNRPSLRVGTAT